MKFIIVNHHICVFVVFLLCLERQDSSARGDSSASNQWIIWQSIRFNWV